MAAILKADWRLGAQSGTAGIQLMLARWIARANAERLDASVHVRWRFSAEVSGWCLTVRILAFIS